jgi:hypothetical protein
MQPLLLFFNFDTMKYILFCLLGFSFIETLAQQKQFSIDNKGKYILYEVVENQTLSKDSLMQRAVNYLNKPNQSSLKQNKITDSSILGNGKIIIDKTLLIASRPSGEFTYNFVFELKLGKYRYWLTDFKYSSYQRDRYGNYVPVKSKAIPLEDLSKKINTAEYKVIFEKVQVKADKIATDFKNALATSLKSKPVEVKKTITTDKW